MKLRNLLLLNLIVFFQSAYSQEGIAVYTDYLTDNYYLIHPSMAGAANCSKLRVTGRQQWFGQQDAPSLQTMSFNTSLDEEGTSVVVETSPDWCVVRLTTCAMGMKPKQPK